MKSLNRVEIIGNTTKDIEVRSMSNGKSVANISVATNNEWKDANGVMQSEVEYHDCVVFGGLADVCGTYLAKGHRVFFAGRLKTRTYENKDGQTVYKKEIIVEDMIMLNGPKGQSNDSKPTRYDNNVSYDDSSIPPSNEIKLEDIPF
jgi:single-strand DNA-binding protein